MSITSKLWQFQVGNQRTNGAHPTNCLQQHGMPRSWKDQKPTQETLTPDVPGVMMILGIHPIPIRARPSSPLPHKVKTKPPSLPTSAFTSTLFAAGAMDRNRQTGGGQSTINDF